MLWVPVAASPEDISEAPHPPRIIVTALGGPPFDLEEARVSMVLVAVGVVVCAVASFLISGRSRPDSHSWPDVVGRLWSVGTLILGACAFLVLAASLANLPTIMWDAVDDRGRPVFGMVVAQSAVGAGLWVIGGLCLLAAGVCGLLGSHRRSRVRSDTAHVPDAASPSRTGPRVTAWPRGNRTHLLAQRLPWAAVAAWVLMIWIPIFDSGDHGDERFIVTSLGSLEFLPTLLLAWAVVLICAATARAFSPFSHWSFVAGLSGVGLLIIEIVLLWMLGGCALIAAGVCGFISDRRRIERTTQQRTPGEAAERSRRLRRLARFLPLITLTAWVITLFIPVIDSFNDSGPRIIMTSLGDWTLDSTTPPDTFDLVLWALIITIAVLGLFFPSARWWAAAAMLIGALIVVLLIGLVLEPPLLMWDGQLPDGTPTGGMEIGCPSVGYGLWVVGAAALISAGICGLLAQTKRPRPAVQGPPVEDV
ncbi:MAG: hypothetical protein ACTIIH_09060 [Brevibacterium sp.]|uniref:hypothetical protein n=1 Tax=Brevibacterium sp. TaxID=1701 RepID=UPI003F8DB197